MIGLFYFVLAVLASPFESKLRLEAENAVLRHQLSQKHGLEYANCFHAGHSDILYCQPFDTLGNHPRHFGLAVCDLLRAVSVIISLSWDQSFFDPIELPTGRKRLVPAF